MIWKFPSNTHVLWVYDFTKDAQILGGAKPLGPLANSSVYWPLLGFFIGFVFPLRVFLSFHISTFLWLLSAAALRCPYMYSPTYAPTHTSKAASFSGCFWVGLASLTGPGMSHLAPSYPRALCTDQPKAKSWVSTKANTTDSIVNPREGPMKCLLSMAWGRNVNLSPVHNLMSQGMWHEIANERKKMKQVAQPEARSSLIGWVSVFPRLVLIFHWTRSQKLSLPWPLSP